MPAEIVSMFPKMMVKFFKEFASIENPLLLDKREDAWLQKMYLLLKSKRREMMQAWISNVSPEEISETRYLIAQLGSGMGEVFGELVRRSRTFLITDGKHGGGKGRYGK